MASSLAGSCGPAMGLARSFRAAKALLPASASVACRKWSGVCELVHMSWGHARGRRASEPGRPKRRPLVVVGIDCRAPRELGAGRAVLTSSVRSLRGPRGAGPAAEHWTSRAWRVPAAAETGHRGQAPCQASGKQVRPGLGGIPAFLVCALANLYSLEFSALKRGLELPLQELVCRIPESSYVKSTYL